MSNSIYDLHLDIVKILKDRGEPIFNPTTKSDLEICRNVPDVYVKGIKFPSLEFVSGHAIQEKDGSITIHNDMLCYQKFGYKLENLGLCDPVLWDVNMDFKIQQKECNKMINNDINQELTKVRLLFREGVSDSDGKLAEYRFTTYVIELPSDLIKHYNEIIGMEILK